MATKTQNQDYEIKEGRTEIIVRGNRFVHPFEEPNTHRNVGSAVLGRKLTIPTAEQTAELLHAAYCGPEEFRQKSQVEEVRNIMKNRWFWVFNRNLWTNEGVYVVSDPEAIGLSQELNQAKLEKRLSESPAGSRVMFSSDGTIRFAPKDSYRLGDHTSESFAKDGFVIASFGVDGAEKLGQVASAFRYEPRTWGLEIGKQEGPIQRVSAVDGYGGGLALSGDYRGDGRDGYASGVLD